MFRWRGVEFIQSFGGKALEKLRSRSSDKIKKDILGRKVVRLYE
jgi:hypothetical protein